LAELAPATSTHLPPNPVIGPLEAAEAAVIPTAVTPTTVATVAAMANPTRRRGQRRAVNEGVTY
ncbi:hypothetical protein AB0M46_44690, partial [Dactylosporangium sp. NPDC051485]|uniref:hypothetical protein n=1 Tax=Dactylosporangium sp. NPDC051485 TaxID=3154846 RepID=UPI003448EACC